jgi:hypothetical protein
VAGRSPSGRTASTKIAWGVFTTRAQLGLRCLTATALLNLAIEVMFCFSHRFANGMLGHSLAFAGCLIIIRIAWHAA